MITASYSVLLIVPSFGSWTSCPTLSLEKIMGPGVFFVFDERRSLLPLLVLCRSCKQEISHIF